MRSISLEDNKIEYFSNLKAGDLRSHDKFGNKLSQFDVICTKKTRLEVRKLKEIEKKKHNLKKGNFHIKKVIEIDGCKVPILRRKSDDPSVIAERRQRAENTQKNRERKERIAKSKLKKMYNN